MRMDAGVRVQGVPSVLGYEWAGCCARVWSEEWRCCRAQRCRREGRCRVCKGAVQRRMAFGVERSTSIEVRVATGNLQPHVFVAMCLAQFFCRRRAQGMLRSRRRVVGCVRGGCCQRSIVCIVRERALPGPCAHEVVLHLELLEPTCAETSLCIRVIRSCRKGLRLVTD